MKTNSNSRSSETLAEVLAKLSWGGSGYSPYALECKSKPSEAETAAKNNAGADRAAAGAQFGKMDEGLSDLDGASAQDTGMYKRTMSQATDDTTQAWNAARVARSARARMSGFGYAQPIAQSDQMAADRSEASDLGRLPIDIANQVEPMRLQAAGMHEGAAATELGSANTNQKQWGDMETERAKRRGSMWAKLGKLGIGAGMMVAGGLTGNPLLMSGGVSTAGSSMG